MMYSSKLIDPVWRDTIRRMVNISLPETLKLLSVWKDIEEG